MRDCLLSMFYQVFGNQRCNMPAWILAIVSHWSVKTIGIILVIVLVGGGLYIWHANTATTNYTRGYKQALTDHPQNIFNAPSTINQQPCPAPTVYGIDIGRWAIGLVHKK